MANESQAAKLLGTESRLASAEAELIQQRRQTTAAAASKSDELKLIHPSNVPKPPIYSGKKEEWERFKHVFVAWSSTVHPKFPDLRSTGNRQM